MTNKDDDRLQGRAPEFATMSRRPALATGIVPELARRTTLSHVIENADVVREVRIDGKRCAVGRTISNKVRATLPVLVQERLKDIRGRRAAAQRAALLRHAPHLVEAREAKRAAHEFRAKHLRRRKGSL